jgi:phosphoglycerate dehydrogenase-like enzyme
LARSFRMRVLAGPSRLEGRSPADYNSDELFSVVKPALLETLARTDALVLSMPHTPETEGMIGAAEFAALKSGAYFVNIARGKVVNELALIRALQSGHLSGAALDVFDTEPLPPENPLWEMPNVVVTPHSASTVYAENSRIIDLFLENLDLFLAGRVDKIRNVLDKERLY